MIHATLIFCDIVGFSRNDDDFQTRLICRLSAEVTHELFYRLSEAEPPVIFLPTGDGLAIALLEKGHAPPDASRKAEVFSLINRLMRFAVASRPKDGAAYLRIAVHRGAVSLIRDINGHPNVCGHAMNDCQRIMDAAHGNQVLLSSEAYRTLVGGKQPLYSGPPFDEKHPARFSDPLTVVDKHGLKIETRIMYREGDKGWERKEPFPRGAINGKTERTRFIVNQLNNLLKEPHKKLTIYEQSALSTFGISEQRIHWDHAPAEYVDLILEQKLLLKELADQERTTIKLILRPIRKYEPQWMAARCEALLAWLHNSRPNAGVVVVEDYDVHNRFIVKDHFCVDGYKIHDTSGYELSLVRTAPHEIDEAVESFDRVFRKLNQTKEEVIGYFEQLRATSLAQNLKSQA